MQVTGSVALTLQEGAIQLPHPADDPSDPMWHLATALGSCLLRFADRFLERRGFPRHARIQVAWKVQVQACRVEGLRASLEVDQALEDGERAVLERMLGSCPVHGALTDGVPATIYLNAEPDRQAG